MWYIKIGRDISGTRDPKPIPGPPNQGFSARKISPHKFWLKKQWGFGGRKKLWDSQVSPLKGSAVDLELRQTFYFWASVLGNGLMRTSGIRGETEVSGIRTGARGQLPPRQNSRGQAVDIVSH